MTVIMTNNITYFWTRNAATIASTPKPRKSVKMSATTAGKVVASFAPVIPLRV